MEHRWGERLSLWADVRVHYCGESADGRVRDASLSGAYVETPLRLPSYCRIELEFHGVAIPACVVRQNATGVGVEWCEFAPSAIIRTLTRLAAVQHVRVIDVVPGDAVSQYHST
jgi:hypothetical protein